MTLSVEHAFFGFEQHDVSSLGFEQHDVSSSLGFEQHDDSSFSSLGLEHDMGKHLIWRG